jgi:hypothetical protein
MAPVGDEGSGETGQARDEIKRRQTRRLDGASIGKTTQSSGERASEKSEVII